MQTLRLFGQEYIGLSATISFAFVVNFDLIQLFVVIHEFIHNFIHDEQMFDFRFDIILDSDDQFALGY